MGRWYRSAAFVLAGILVMSGFVEADEGSESAGQDTLYLGMLDLLGPPVEFQYTTFGGTGWPEAVPEDVGMPVSVLLVADQSPDGASSTRLVLVDAIEGSASRTLLDEIISAQNPDGGGFNTINSIRFESDGEGAPLVLSLFQTVYPAPSELPAMPGAPVESRWRLSDGVYVPIG